MDENFFKIASYQNYKASNVSTYSTKNNFCIGQRKLEIISEEKSYNISTNYSSLIAKKLRPMITLSIIWDISNSIIGNKDS